MNYDNVAKSAHDAISSVGTTFTLSRPTGGSFDAVTGLSVGVAPATYVGHAVVSRYSAREIDGTRIRVGDKKLIVAARDGFPCPDVADSAVIGGEAWKILGVDVVAPGGIPVLYNVQVRK